MAINFKELNDRLELSPLSDKELVAVAAVEKWIDSEITDRFKGDELRFNLYQVQFKRTISDQGSVSWPDARRRLMYDELKSRYGKAGWECTEEFADSQDRYGQDYFVLKGKK
jgi:hypothetical protein